MTINSNTNHSLTQHSNSILILVRWWVGVKVNMKMILWIMKWIEENKVNMEKSILRIGVVHEIVVLSINCISMIQRIHQRILWVMAKSSNSRIRNSNNSNAERVFKVNRLNRLLLRNPLIWMQRNYQNKCHLLRKLSLGNSFQFTQRRLVVIIIWVATILGGITLLLVMRMQDTPVSSQLINVIDFN